MVSTRTRRRPDFATQARREMKRQGVGYRGLARRIVGPKASLQQLDNMRGQLRDWLGDPPKHKPSLKNRKRIAAALGMDESLADEDEESDPLTDVVDQMMRDLKRVRDGLTLDRGGIA